VHPDRFFPINNRVGDKNETLSIHYNDESSTLASFVEDVNNVSYVKNEKIQKIDVISIDPFFKDGIIKEIDFIKIDTAGFEHQVLLGSQEIINKYKPKFIQIEYNWHQLFSGQSLFTLSKLLDGYQPYQPLKDRLEICDSKDPLTNIYLLSNYIFVRDDLVETIV
jgi:FkbM family methyltransferase